MKDGPLRRSRRRIAGAVGIPQINQRLDQLETSQAAWEQRLRSEVEEIRDAYGALEVAYMARARSFTDAAVGLAREHTDRAVADMARHVVELARLHAEAAIIASQATTINDLRMETNAASQHALKESVAHTNAAVLAMQAALRAEADRLHQQTEAANAVVLRGMNDLRRRLDEVEHIDGVSTAWRVEASEEPTADRSATAARARSTAGVAEEWLYAALEDVFRGDSQLVAKRQLVYLPHVQSSVDADHPLVDLGCGRGEWLSLLRESEIPAVGVESNNVFADEAVASGLDVSSGDLLDFLERAAPGSFGAITLFQVLEHLPFGTVVDVMRSAARALRPGGVLIAEVPNAKNLRVGAGTFWIDPTHERPWYPDVLEFLARSAGFADVQGLYLHPMLDEPDVSGVPDNIAVLLRRLLEAVDGAVDYAVVARMASDAETER